MNYLSVINKEHLKDPYYIDYGIGRGVVWDKLLGSLLEELKIDPQELGSINSLYEVNNPSTLEKMIKSLSENLNELGEIETESMVKTGMLKFVIMEIWKSLSNFYNEDEREEALKYFLQIFMILLSSVATKIFSFGIAIATRIHVLIIIGIPFNVINGLPGSLLDLYLAGITTIYFFLSIITLLSQSILSFSYGM